MSAPRRGGWALWGGAAGSGRARGAGPAARREGERNLPPFFNRPARASPGLTMAPLLGRKPFPLAKPLPPGEPGERFVIPHTQEAFRTREYPPHRGRSGAGVGPGAVELNKALVGPGGERDREESAADAAAGSLFPEEFRSLFQAGGGSGTAAPRGWSGPGAELTGTGHRPGGL